VAVPAALQSHLFREDSRAEFVLLAEVDEPDAGLLQQVNELDNVHAGLILHLHHPCNIFNTIGAVPGSFQTLAIVVKANVTLRRKSTGIKGRVTQFLPLICYKKAILFNKIC